MAKFQREGGAGPTKAKAYTKPTSSKDNQGGYTTPSNLVNPSQRAIQNRGGYSVADVTTGLPFTPERLQQVTSPGYGGGGGGGGSLGGGLAPSVGVPGEAEYQASDSILTAALAALDRAVKDYEAQYTADTETYDRDYNKGLGNLGWRDPQDEVVGNFGWDWNDVLTSSGRAYQNQNNDFASRGMLQSSGYADALAALDRSLNDQKGAMDTSRKDYLGELGRGRSEFQNQDTLARQQARAESTARRAAQYGVV